MPDLMNATAYAARRGVGKSAVSNWKKAGLLVMAPDPANPGKMLIDAEKTDMILRGSIDPTRGRPTKAAASQAVSQAAPSEAQDLKKPYVSPMEAARLEEMQERILRRQLERAQLTGQLVDLGEYSSRIANLARLVRERTIGVIRMNAEALAEETDPRAVTALLTDAFDKMFDSVSREIETEADQEEETDNTLLELESLEDLVPGSEDEDTTT